MAISPDTLIAERYKLVECLGAGGMGEVWKAADTNFTRLVVVAVKLLKEDETFADDARNRKNVDRYLQREAAAGHLTFELIVNALDECFNAGAKRDLLRAAALARFSEREVTSEDAMSFFDQLADDSTFNENARHRRRLRDLFATEANSVAILQHPNIVRVTDYGEHSGVPFLVMDFINGRTLQQVIQRREPMPLIRRLRLMEDLCEGLAYAHSKDLVHRDIKPANLIIDGETQRLKVLDFGVVRTMQLSAQRSVSMGVPIGTYCYMSPEQTRAARTLDNRSDIFSVGLVFYEFLSFQRAFPSEGDISELIGRIQRDPPPPLRDLVPDVDPRLEAIVYKAIEKVPAKRYQDLAEMQRDVEALRRRLEEEERQQLGAETGRTQRARPRPLLQQLTDLVDRATTAFDTGDDHAVIEFCDQILSLAAGQADALELKERARQRIKRQLVEAAIAEARALVERGELTAAGKVLERSEIDSKLAVVRDFASELAAARRSRRLTQMIRDARRLLDEGAFDDAIARANAVLEVEAANADARQIIERARSTEASQRRQAIETAIRAADAAARDNRLDDAIRALLPASGDADVDARIDALQRDLDARVARDRGIAEALARARGLIASESFSQALEVLAQAKSLDPGHGEMAELRGRLRTIVHGIAEVDGAIRLFDQNAPAAEDRAESAVEHLQSHRDAFASVRARLAELDAARARAADRERARLQREREADEERQRRAHAAEEEQLRQERAAEEERQRQEREAERERQRLAREAEEAAQERQRQAVMAEQQRIADAIAAATKAVRAALKKERFEEAERAIEKMAALAGSAAAVATLQTELADLRQQAIDRAAFRERDAVRKLAARGDLEGALARLQKYAPPHPLIDAEMAEVADAIRARDEQRARDQGERKRQEAERERLEQEHLRAAEAERQREQAEQARSEEERLDAHLHALAETKLRLEEAEAEAAEQERIDTERRELIARARAANERRDFGAAFGLIGRAETLAPANADVLGLRAEILAGVRSALQQDPSNAALQELLSRYAPHVKRRKLLQMSTAAALATVIGLGSWWLSRQGTSERTPESTAATSSVSGPPTGLTDPPVDFGRTVQEARDKYQRRDVQGAISTALSVPETAAERSQAMNLLDQIRADADARAVADQRDAETAGKRSEIVFQQGVKKQSDAQQRVQPADTWLAVTLFGEASALFRQATSSGWSSARLLQQARNEYAASRLPQAIDFALQALARGDGSDAAAFLRSIRTTAATDAATAAREARNAGATEANSLSFKDAVSKQDVAERLTSPTDTRAAVDAFGAATVAYANAIAEAQAFVARRNAELLDGHLRRANERLKAQDLAGATAAIQEAARLNAADPRLADLKGRAESLRAALALSPVRADIDRALSEAAKMTSDNDAIARLERELTKYSGNAEISDAIARRLKARDDKIADLARRAQGASDAQAVAMLSEALGYNPGRTDIRDELERRRASVSRVNPPPPRTRWESEIGRALEGYQAAYANRNAEELLRIAPFKTREQIDNEFKNFRSIQLSFEGVNIAVDDTGARASVSCTISAVRVPAGVSARSINDKRAWQFQLTNAGGVWRITSATASR